VVHHSKGIGENHAKRMKEKRRKKGYSYNSSNTEITKLKEEISDSSFSSFSLLPS
jgi:hypothetical protein